MQFVHRNEFVPSNEWNQVIEAVGIEESGSYSTAQCIWCQVSIALTLKTTFARGHFLYPWLTRYAFPLAHLRGRTMACAPHILS